MYEEIKNEMSLRVSFRQRDRRGRKKFNFYLAAFFLHASSRLDFFVKARIDIFFVMSEHD